jgi:hypothetical protein
MYTGNRSQQIAAIGIAFLIIGSSFFYVSSPSYVTEVETKASDKHAMADEIGNYSMTDINTVPFKNLSSAEQTAFSKARQSVQKHYSDRGASNDGSVFEYRNDIVNQYFVTYDRDLYLVTVVIYIRPVLSVSSVFTGIFGIGLLVVAYWKS